MPPIQIKLADDRTAFSPGETIVGTVAWQLPAPPKKAELDILWITQGKGTADVAVAHQIPFTRPQARDTRPFSIQLPDAPYTFSGQLIALTWHLEVNIDSGKYSEGLEITIAPGGRGRQLPRLRHAA